MGYPYLAGKDDDFVDGSSCLVLQELAHDETTKGAGPDNGKIFVSGHMCRLVLSLCGSVDEYVGTPCPLIYPNFSAQVTYC